MPVFTAIAARPTGYHPYHPQVTKEPSEIGLCCKGTFFVQNHTAIWGYKPKPAEFIRQLDFDYRKTC